MTKSKWPTFGGSRNLARSQKLERQLHVLRIAGRRLGSSQDLGFVQAVVFQMRRQLSLDQVAEQNRKTCCRQQLVAASHFCDHHQGSDRNSSRRTENSNHSHNYKSCSWKMNQRGEESAQHGTDKKCRSENPA